MIFQTLFLIHDIPLFFVAVEQFSIYDADRNIKNDKYIAFKIMLICFMRIKQIKCKFMEWNSVLLLQDAKSNSNNYDDPHQIFWFIFIISKEEIL